MSWGGGYRSGYGGGMGMQGGGGGGMRRGRGGMLENKIAQVLNNMMGSPEGNRRQRMNQMNMGGSGWGSSYGQRRYGAAGGTGMGNRMNSNRRGGQMQGRNMQQSPAGTKKGGKLIIQLYNEDRYCDVCEKVINKANDKTMEDHQNGRRHKALAVKNPGGTGTKNIIFKHYCRTCNIEILEDDWNAHRESSIHKVSRATKLMEKSGLNLKIKTDSEEPEGVEFLSPVDGFYCNLCRRFYSDENAAKVEHCKSRDHVEKARRVKAFEEKADELQEKMNNIVEDAAVKTMLQDERDVKNDIAVGLTDDMEQEDEEMETEQDE